MLKIIGFAVAAWLFIFWPIYIIYTITKIIRHVRS